MGEEVVLPWFFLHVRPGKMERRPWERDLGDVFQVKLETGKSPTSEKLGENAETESAGFGKKKPCKTT